MEDWKKIKLGEVLKLSKVISDSPDSNKRIRVKLNIGGVEKRPDTNDIDGATRYYIRKAGQFIYGTQNLHKGAFGIVPPELDGFESSQDIPSFDVDEQCYPEWIFYFFKQGDFYLKLETLAKGVGSKRINPSKLLELLFFLPPKSEQRRILESLYDFENRAKSLDAEIKYQLDLIEDLHRKTLEDAFSGKLTETYRLDKDKNLGGGLELLNSIQEKKEILIAEKQISKERLLTKIQSNEFPYSIPNSWTWCRMNDISVKLGAGSTPTGGRAVYVNNGIKFFRSMNIYNDGIRTEDIAYIDEATHERMKGTHIKPNDILLNITGGSIGRCALVPSEFDSGNVSQHVAIIRLMDPQMVEYIHFLITSPYFQETIMNVQVGVSREGLSMSSLKMIKIPLPPIDEILAIVRLLKDFKATKDKLKAVVDKSKEDFNLMKKNILKEAFGNINLEIDNMAKSKSMNDKGTFHPNIVESLRDYTKDPSLQELEELLTKNGKMSALALWKMSRFEKDIDGFYEDLKEKVEITKTIVESDEKGFLELAI